MTPETLTTIVAVLAAVSAAAILVWYLVRAPAFTRGTLVLLFLGLGVLPITAALVGNVKGYEETKQVEFCSGCHVMQPWVDDVRDTEANTLASLHARSELFAESACYECHADYGMYGAVATKLQGTKHLWAYFTHGYAGMDTDEAAAKIELYAPFPNGTCIHCHSTQLPGWNDEPEHMAVADDVRSGATSCGAAGCHGPAHGVKRTAP